MEKPVTMVTGVSKGIGKAIAEDMMARGHHVLGLSRTRPGAWFEGSHFAVDLADARALSETLQRVTAEHRVLRLVNNAAISIAAALYGRLNPTLEPPLVALTRSPGRSLVLELVELAP